MPSAPRMRAGRRSLPQWLNIRQQKGTSVSPEFTGECGMTSDLVARLGLCRELEGHTGCVNCIQWSAGGRLLASGSDDKAVIVWDGLAGKKVVRLETPHEGNIFSVVWLPGEEARGLLATGAGDRRVCLLDTNTNSVLRSVVGHSGRVKRLAVAADSPGLIWSGSEDGTVRQWDLREKWTGHVVDNNVLVNLNMQNTRVNSPSIGCEVKCLSVCPARTELVAVGGNDPYVRLYDRRMMNPGKAGVGMGSPGGGAVSYFVPGHLPGTEAAYHKKLRPLTATYVTFSHDGSELLVNLGGEQIYLYDKFALHGDRPLQVSPLLSAATTDAPTLPPAPPLNTRVEAVKLAANVQFEAGEYLRAVELYNTALALHGGPHPLLCGNRAAALMRRRWDGDVYAALRDCLSALEADPGHIKAHLRLARCLADLGWKEEAVQCLAAFKRRHPEHRRSQHCVELEQELEEGELEEKRGREEEERKGRRKKGLPRGLGAYTAAAFLKEALDSDDDEEEDDVGMETFDGEEVKWGALEVALRREARDYSARFLGACNTTTDIKEANFLGRAGNFIMAGSDDGKFFIWDRRSGNIVRVLVGDESIVNCLQGHPDTPILATSGIDPVVRLWQPGPQDGHTDSREVEDRDGAAGSNQRRMNADPFETILLNMGVPMRLGEEEGEGEGGEEGAVQCRPS